MTKEIELTQGQKALVDDEDFEWLSQWKWHAHWNKATKSFYAIRNKSVKNKQRCTVFMSREIMSTPNNLVADHINHNTLDNRKANLRNVTYSQNNINRKKRDENKSGFKGVSLHQGKYQSEIKVDSKRYYLGVFDTPEEAANVYNKAAEKLHSEFRIKP